MGADDAQRVSLFEQQQRTYMILQSVLLGLGQPEWALGVAAQAKARALLYHLAAGSGEHRGEHDAAVGLQLAGLCCRRSPSAATMSGRADVPRLPLGLTSVDRLTVEHIARVSTGHPTPRSTAATSASRPGSVRNSPRSVSGYPHAASMPAIHGSDSRARSVAGDLASLESRAMDSAQSSAKILKQLYEELHCGG